ncbi:MAG: hypothetical protein ACYCZB_18205, partial [Acidiphilium sp.]
PSGKRQPYKWLVFAPPRSSIIAAAPWPGFAPPHTVVDAVAKSGGLTAETVAAIKAGIFGVQQPGAA